MCRLGSEEKEEDFHVALLGLFDRFGGTGGFVVLGGNGIVVVSC